MNLTPSTYHSIEANRACVSHSQIKAWQQCPARWHAEAIAGTYTRTATDALLIGSYVDVALTAPDEFDAWRESQPGMLKKNGEPYAKFDQADEMIAAVRRHPAAMERLTGDGQVIVTASVNGVPCRCMMDTVRHDARRITDLKTTRDMFDTQWDATARQHLHWIDSWDYWQQLAFYQTLGTLAFGWEPGLDIVAVDKVSPPLVRVFEMSGYPDADMKLRLAQKRIADALAEMAPYRSLDNPPPMVMEDAGGLSRDSRCGTCGYCRATAGCDVMQWDETSGKWTAKLEG